jgi:hypothetical protein
MGAVKALVPAGRTPLTSAVEQAANILDFRRARGLFAFPNTGCSTEPAPFLPLS